MSTINSSMRGLPVEFVGKELYREIGKVVVSLRSAAKEKQVQAQVATEARKAAKKGKGKKKWSVCYKDGSPN